MGVPAFFRWLSKKYPSIVVHCIEDGKKVIDDVTVFPDASLPNPNDFEFDNLYLDMNGIIHPCCHPENKPAPKNEDEMMVLIFEYIDRIFNICRPRKLLYMAIDGVAPRAKMNQQRSRRFRASKETVEKIDEMSRIRQELELKGCEIPPPKPKGEHFDSNCITPGTPFMARLAECLNYYIYDRLNNNPGWKDIKVVLSDAKWPRKRNQLKKISFPHLTGLATHEPNFTIIREEFKPNQPRPCELCAQIGHTMKECTGLPKEKCGEFDELSKPVCEETQFIFIKLAVLREYLEKDLQMVNLPFTYEFERALDDWVFMCFFVGNDFLPHLPSLEIREGAIDRLVRLYKDTVMKTGGYITDSGHVSLERVQVILTNLGDAEDEIFKRRQQNELNFKQRLKDRKKREKLMNDKPAWTPRGKFQPERPGSTPNVIQNPRQEAYHMRMQAQSYHSDTTHKYKDNKNAAKDLWDELKKGKSADNNSSTEPNTGVKRKAENQNADESDEEPADEVRLWEDGWKERYYESKFNVSGDTTEFKTKVAHAYAEGLCWVLKYYYQGCPSWKWFFPYHYAPFASDFTGVAELNIDFEKNTKPFNPMEQLMSVFPAASKQHLPPSWGTLMEDHDSPIIDFYPEDFKIDLNGKKWAWQGVALLPFVDEQRLLTTLKEYYPLLTEDEKKRNMLGNDLLYVRKGHDSFDFFVGLYEGRNFEEKFDLDPLLLQGVGGTALLAEKAVMPNGTVISPISGLENLEDSQSIFVQFLDPSYPADFIYPARRLEGAEEPPRVLKPGDYNPRSSGPWTPQTGMSGRNNRASLDNSGHRAIRHNFNGNDTPNRNNRYSDYNRGNRNQHQSYSSPRSFSSVSPNPAVRSYHDNRDQRSSGSYNQRQQSPYNTPQSQAVFTACIRVLKEQIESYETPLKGYSTHRV
ncbi:5'-3' exoribonuclease 2 [Nymphon striatum]|nr:5'-3' exoribonuclease 2 [Nymphon striatum]